MQNLRNVAFDSTPLPPGLPLTAKAWDTANDASLCTFGPTIEQPVIELRRRASYASHFTTIASWDAPCPLPDLGCDEVLLLQHFAGSGTSCIVLAGGDIVVVREQPSASQERIEIVGSVDVGIAAAAWAADEELLAIVTRGDTLVLMSRDFEPATETSLTPEDLNASKHVSVGWGKKETQFQGKRAKALRDPTMPDVVDEGTPSPYDDGGVTISWRGDGQFLAVNSLIAGHRRAIRVYSREAVLDSTSEPVNGLESALSWRPYGNLIAGIKRSPDKAEVVFFERNGLRHGGFDLRLSSTEAASWARNIRLDWNHDSTILAIGFTDRVQLWTMGNYHYYLKQEIPLSAADPMARIQAIRTKWHPSMTLRVQVDDRRSHLSLTYHTAMNRGSVMPGQDYGIVAVIDGKDLKLTPLRQAGVPPPMAFCEVSLKHNIVDCAVSADGNNIVVLTAEDVVFCRWQVTEVNGAASTSNRTRFSTAVVLEKVVIGREESTSHNMKIRTQIQLCGGLAYVLTPPQNGLPASIHCSNVQVQEPKLNDLEMPPNVNWQNLVEDIGGKVLACQNAEGRLVMVGSDESSTDELVMDENVGRDAVLYRIYQALDTESAVNGHRNTLHSVTLSTGGCLKADSTILAQDCTSFIVTDAHIIFTTSQHLLKFVHLASPDQLNVPKDTPELDERCRSIERGAKIVTVMPSAYAVVLQMPRGNLETIHPRVLVLAGIRAHVQHLDYRSAFLACQNQQVDMNILHDYDPETFMGNIQKFIEQLKKPSSIDEFLSKLKDEDVAQTLYRDTLKLTTGLEADQTAVPSKAPLSDKVNRICTAFLSVLEKMPSTSGFTQNIITAHVCKRSPDLESALTLVSRIRSTSETEADLAISHLCFLTDPNRLYNAALALYDLEVTLLVAQNSQRDPREYMPFLQDLHSMPVHKRQYSIDNHLKNYSKALGSLHAMNDDAAVEAYTIKHSLYSDALLLYKYSPLQRDTITNHYAAYLAAQNSHLQAAILYDSLSLHQQAYPLYALAHAWREALSSATLAQLPQPQLTSLATSLATTLTDESRDYRSAAYIHEHYLLAPLEAATLLCKGSYFADATLLLSRTNPSSIPSIIDPALSTQLAAILSLLSDTRAQATAQSTRLAELRTIKENDPLAFYGGDATLSSGAGIDMNIPDNISIAPTDMTTTTFANGSLFTRAGADSRFGGTQLSTASRKTSKTKRKEERKRARGKKGSVYEEEYLVNSLARLIERWNGVYDEVKRLLGGLGRRGRREEASSVVEGMRDVAVLLVAIKGKVWPEEMGGVVDGVQGGVGGRPSGADGVLFDSQLEVEEGSSGRKEAPELKTWKANEVFV